MNENSRKFYGNGIELFLIFGEFLAIFEKYFPFFNELSIFKKLKSGLQNY